MGHGHTSMSNGDGALLWHGHTSTSSEDGALEMVRCCGAWSYEHEQ